jgi:ATP-binding cassette subfamily B (MDR/TAP) protein 1
LARRSTRPHNPSKRYPPSNYILLTNEGEPNCFWEACKVENNKEWKKEMEEEMQSLLEKKTWELVNLPKGRKSLQNKWVYKIKHEGEGKKETYEARLVVKGFSQKEGIDFTEILSLIVKMSSIRIVLGLLLL